MNFPRLLYYLGYGLRRLRWNKAQLIRYQEKRLKSIVHYAYTHVHFYHNKFKEAGIRPNDIQSLEDLSKLPLVRKNEPSENNSEAARLFRI